VAKPPQQDKAPSGLAGTVVSRTGQPADVIELIMADHRRIRRLRAVLDDAVRCGGESGSGWMLAHVWQRLAGLLEAHTRAEEEICYLPMFGSGPLADERRQAAAADHDDIRAAISEAALQPAGSARWWSAARAVLAISADHLEREERDMLDGWQARLTMSRRRELGRQWLGFMAALRLDAAQHADDPTSTADKAPVSQIVSYYDLTTTFVLGRYSDWVIFSSFVGSPVRPRWPPPGVSGGPPFLYGVFSADSR
jgi:Hemerythrin HHE cation binding domain